MKTGDSIRVAVAETRILLAAARKQQQEAGREIARLATHVYGLEKDLKAGKPYELSITDHAIVRYVERHLGFDVQEFVALVQSKLIPMAAVLGDGDFPLTDALVAVVRNKTVVTIKPA